MVEVPFFTVGMIGVRRWHSPFWWSQRTMDKDYTILVYRCDVPLVGVLRKVLSRICMRVAIDVLSRDP